MRRGSAVGVLSLIDGGAALMSRARWVWAVGWFHRRGQLGRAVGGVVQCTARWAAAILRGVLFTFHGVDRPNIALQPTGGCHAIIVRVARG